MKVGFGLYKNSLNKDNYKFVNQIGATHIVAHLTNYFSGSNPEISSGEENGWGICENEPIWDIELLSGLKKEINENGLELEAIENFNPLHWYDILLDGPEKFKQIENLKKPNIIFTHTNACLNIDHKIVNNAVITACRPKSFEFVKKIYFFEILSSTEWNIKDNKLQ